MRYIVLCFALLLAQARAEAKDLTVVKLEGATTITIVSEKIGSDCQIVAAEEETRSGEKNPVRTPLQKILDSLRLPVPVSLWYPSSTKVIELWCRHGHLEVIRDPTVVRSIPFVPMRPKRDTGPHRLSALHQGRAFYLYTYVVSLT